MKNLACCNGVWTFSVDSCTCLITLPLLENLVGFLNTPYEVNEPHGSETVTVGVISGQLSSQIALLLTTRDGTATREYFTMFSSVTLPVHHYCFTII